MIQCCVAKNFQRVDRRFEPRGDVDLALLSGHFFNGHFVKSFRREVCTDYFKVHPVCIGGEGLVIDIAETCILKRKYKRGMIISNQK